MDEGTAEGGDGFSSALNSLPALPPPALGPALRGEKGEGKAMVLVHKDLMTQNLGECECLCLEGQGQARQALLEGLEPRRQWKRLLGMGLG